MKVVLILALLALANASFLSFDFAPNSPKSIPNPLGSTISLKCALTTSDSSDNLFGSMKSGTGKVNGKAIPASGLAFTIKNGDVVTIEGSSGSEIAITNKGSNNVHAECNLALGAAESPNSFLSFDFQPNSPKSIPNPLGSTISLKCALSSADASDVMFGIMKAGTGKVNGKTVPASGLSFNIKNGDVISIEGSAGSEVSITNKGSSKVHADCDLAAQGSFKKKKFQSFNQEGFLGSLAQLANAANDLRSLDFLPNVPQSISNPLFWEISASCSITSVDASDILQGKVTSGSGSLNGKSIPAAGLQTTVKNGEKLALDLSASAELTITNLGKSKVHADCSLGIMEKIEEMFKELQKKKNPSKKHQKKRHGRKFRIFKLLLKLRLASGRKH